MATVVSAKDLRRDRLELQRRGEADSRHHSPAQHVNHVLPGELHRDHRTLDFVRSRRGHIIQLPGQAPYLESGGS